MRIRPPPTDPPEAFRSAPGLPSPIAAARPPCRVRPAAVAEAPAHGVARLSAAVATIRPVGSRRSGNSAESAAPALPRWGSPRPESPGPDPSTATPSVTPPRSATLPLSQTRRSELAAPARWPVQTHSTSPRRRPCCARRPRGLWCTSVMAVPRSRELPPAAQARTWRVR